MRKVALLLGAAALLGGCDYVRVSFGGNAQSETAAVNTSAAAPAPAPGPFGFGNAAQPSDAGVTSSRSLEPPVPGPDPGDGAAGGGKDPSAGGGEAGGGGVNVTPAMLVGRWGDNGDCSAPIEFFANGSFRSGNGGRGNWRLAGDTVTLSGGQRSIALRIVSISADEVMVRDPQGQLGRSARC